MVETGSFSGLVFGSVPESYPLSGALLAAAFLLLADAARPGGRLRIVPWILVASTAFGVTATNLGLVGIPLLVAAMRTQGSRARAIGATAGVLLLSAALAVVELLALNAAYGEWLPLRKIERTDPFLAPRPMATARSFPEALVSTVLPDRPAVVTNEIGLRRDYPIKLMFTIEGGPQGAVSRLLRGLVVAGFLLLGALKLARLEGRGPPMLWAALGVLAFNFALHSVYRGPDLLLYSMHWHAALAVVIGAAALGPAGPRRRRPPGRRRALQQRRGAALDGADAAGDGLRRIATSPRIPTMERAKPARMDLGRYSKTTSCLPADSSTLRIMKLARTIAARSPSTFAVHPG